MKLLKSFKLLNGHLRPVRWLLTVFWSPVVVRKTPTLVSGHEMSVEPRLWCFGDGTFDPFGNILWCYESWKVFKQGQLLLKNSEMSFWSQLNRFLKVWSEVVSGIYVIVWFIIFIKKNHFPGVWVFAHFLIRNLRIKKP